MAVKILQLLHERDVFLWFVPNCTNQIIFSHQNLVGHILPCSML